MKRFCLIIAALVVFAACSPQTGVDETETASFSDSTQYLQFDLNVEWPSGQSAVAQAVRSTLLDVLHQQTVNLGFYTGPLSITGLAEKSPALESVVSYYGAEAVKNLSSLAEEDARSRIEVGCDASDFPGYECSCELRRIGVTDRYWVYQSSNYVYLGGAHGGETGAGYLTFRKEDGALIKGFIDKSHVIAMQPLFRKGLLQYFADCGDPVSEGELTDRLFLEEDGIIPLPSYEPFPTEDGLAFVYQQYEIAPYAIGMPAFTIPFDEVRPYLSEDASRLLL